MITDGLILRPSSEGKKQHNTFHSDEVAQTTNIRHQQASTSLAFIDINNCFSIDDKLSTQRPVFISTGQK